MIAELALALGLGVGLGVITGLPLGVVNVAVAATAARHGQRAGIAIGLGGAVADATHAMIGFAGLAPMIATRPALANALTLASGVMLLIFAGYLVRPRRSAEASTSPTGDDDRRRGTLRHVATGVVLTLPNPAALAAWVAVATALGAHRSTAASIATAIGVGLGSAVYFAGLAMVAARSARTLTRPGWLDRGAALAIGTVGVVALVRATLRVMQW